jgi:outer membrane biosynthesis protein TonB
MTTLERPLPLPVVMTALALCCAGGFAMGLTNALKIDRGGVEAPKQPLAEVSGVPVKEATPALAYEPPPVEPPKPKAVEVQTVEQEAPPPAPVVEAPPAPVAPKPTEPKPVEPPPPRSIEDLY